MLMRYTDVVPTFGGTVREGIRIQALISVIADKASNVQTTKTRSGESVL
jgi:hypothetical protein